MLYTLELDYTSLAYVAGNPNQLLGEFVIKTMVKQKGIIDDVSKFFEQPKIDCGRYGFPKPPNRSGVVLQVEPTTRQPRNGRVRLKLNLNVPLKGVSEILLNHKRKFKLALTPVFSSPGQLAGFSELSVVANAWEFSK